MTSVRHHRPHRLLPVAGATLAMLTACGGGGSGGGAPAQPAAALAVPATDAGLAPAASASEETLARNASRHVVSGVTTNAVAAGEAFGAVSGSVAPLAAFTAGGGDPTILALAGAFDGSAIEPAITAFVDRSEAGGGDATTFADPSAANHEPDALGALAEEDSELATFVAASLATEAPARVMRDGDRLTFDPDDERLCVDATLADERADCLALAARIDVVLDAASEASGIVTWRFDGVTALQAAYAPGAVTWELRLDGYAGVLRASAALDGEADAVPETMRGAVRLALRVDDETPGAEAGSVALSVSDAIDIRHADLGTRVELAPSTLLSMTADAATGDADVDVSLSALRLVAGFENDVFGTVERSSFGLAFGELVFRATIDGASGAMRVDRVGLGNSPLTVAVDGQDLMRLFAPTLAATITDEGMRTRLDSDLDWRVEFVADAASGAAVSARARAAAGTELLDRGDDRLAVGAGGPLTLDLVAPDENGGQQERTVVVRSGECLDGTVDYDVVRRCD